MDAIHAALRPTFTAPDKYISADEFLNMSNSPEYANCYVELVEGRVIEMSWPKLLRGYVATQLGLALATRVKSQRLGMVLTSEIGFVLARRPTGRDTVRGIDISYLSNERLPDQVANEWIEGAPDLAVEVMSPSNTVSDINLKIRQLLDAGARAVWIADLATRSVQVHAAQGIRIFLEDDALTGGEVLPDFSIKVADIFPA